MFDCLGLDTNSWVPLVSPLHKSVEFPTSNRTEMKVVSLSFFVLISINQYQGFFIPPKNSIFYNNNCQQGVHSNSGRPFGVHPFGARPIWDPSQVIINALIEEVVQELVNEDIPPSPAQPSMLEYDYPPLKRFLVKTMVDKLWRLQQKAYVNYWGPRRSRDHHYNPYRVPLLVTE